MNIKIQGGGDGKYANTGTCFGVVSYLRHEDMARAAENLPVEPFFDQAGNVLPQEVTQRIDQNKAKLCKSDAKFYVMTVSPSAKEQAAMGNTPEERAETFKGYIRDCIMEQYAQGFDKGLTKDDIMYFAKIHHERKAGGEMNMHAHVIISRKDIHNKKKISPKTNHTGTKKTGTVKGGFDRKDFYRRCEKGFDNYFDHTRDLQDSFDYLNTMKRGTFEEQKEMIEKKVKEEVQKEKQITKPQIKPRDRTQITSELELMKALKENDFVKVNDLKEKGYKPSEDFVNILRSSGQLGRNKEVAIEKIFNLAPARTFTAVKLASRLSSGLNQEKRKNDNEELFSNSKKKKKKQNRDREMGD